MNVHKIKDPGDQKYKVDNDLVNKDLANKDPALVNNDQNEFQIMITYVAQMKCTLTAAKNQ